jgi:hypothetical protein
VVALAASRGQWSDELVAVTALKDILPGIFWAALAVGFIAERKIVAFFCETRLFFA